MAGIDRRNFLQISTAGIAVLGVGCTGTRSRPATSGVDTATPDTATPGDTSTPGETGTSTCSETSTNIEGPFYREDPPDRDMLDLYGDKGTPVQLEGTLMGTDCAPIVGATIDFWHADPDGGYDTETDEMRYYGRVTTDADGRWQFQSLMPGFYLNGSQYRPAHIHVKIIIDGAEVLTTQLYFKDDPYIPVDQYVKDDLIMDYTVKDGAWIASFDFVVE